MTKTVVFTKTGKLFAVTDVGCVEPEYKKYKEEDPKNFGSYSGQYVETFIYGGNANQKCGENKGPNVGDPALRLGGAKPKFCEHPEDCKCKPNHRLEVKKHTL